MSADFYWESDRRNSQLLRCVSEARSWQELRPAFVSAWVRFAEILGTKVPPEVRNEIILSFFSSSGRVTFGHGRRPNPPGSHWEAIPLEYVWTVMCNCRWIEEQWYA